MQKENNIIMSKNITLTECNLASNCYNEDCEIIYPKTIAEQVKISDNQTLSDWINSLDIPSKTTIDSDYSEGLKVASVKEDGVTTSNLKIPYLSNGLGVINDGLPVFDWNYFSLNQVNNIDKIQFELLWSLNNIFDSSEIVLGSILNKNSDLLTSITMPKPSIKYTNNTNDRSFDISLLLGEVLQSEINIPYNDIKNSSKSYHIVSNLTNNTISLLDDNGIVSTISYNDTTYTASKGITITNNNDVQHTNEVEAGNNASSITNDGKLKIPTLSYDSNGHITGKENNYLTIPQEELHPSAAGMITNGISAHYFNLQNFTDGVYIPIIKSFSSNNEKIAFVFEVLSREDCGTGYAKYYFQHSNVTSDLNNLLCLSFYPATVIYNGSQITTFAFKDIVYTITSRVVGGVSGKEVNVYKKVTKRGNDGMFIVNILSENKDYSTQHYFYTNNSSTAEEGYNLLYNDLRIGSLTQGSQSTTIAGTLTARLENDIEDTSVTLTAYYATNATFYTE